MFLTQKAWEIEDPIYDLLDGQHNHYQIYKTFGFMIPMYVYHIHINISNNGSPSENHMVLCNFEDTLEMLNNYPGSTLDIQTPQTWSETGRVAIHPINSLYVAVEMQKYIAECADGRLILLDLDPESVHADLHHLVKELIWSQASVR